MLCEILNPTSLSQNYLSAEQRQTLRTITVAITAVAVAALGTLAVSLSSSVLGTLGGLCLVAASAACIASLVLRIAERVLDFAPRVEQIMDNAEELLEERGVEFPEPYRVILSDLLQENAQIRADFSDYIQSLRQERTQVQRILADEQIPPMPYPNDGSPSDRLVSWLVDNAPECLPFITSCMLESIAPINTQLLVYDLIPEGHATPTELPTETNSIRRHWDNERDDQHLSIWTQRQNGGRRYRAFWADVSGVELPIDATERLTFQNRRVHFLSRPSNNDTGRQVETRVELHLETIASYRDSNANCTQDLQALFDLIKELQEYCIGHAARDLQQEHSLIAVWLTRTDHSFHNTEAARHVLHTELLENFLVPLYRDFVIHISGYPAG